MSRRTKSMLGLLLLLGFVDRALAIDVPIEGNRLRLADLRATRRAHVVLRSAAIDLIAVDPTATGAILDIYGTVTSHQVTLAMPAANWIAKVPGKRFRFSLPGDAKVKAQLANGRLVIEMRGTSGFPLGQTEGSVAVRLTIGDTRYCALFGGEIRADDDRHFVARQAPAPASCPAPPNECPGPCPGDACHVGVCNPTTRTCILGAARPDGTTCDDGIGCTTASSCQGGVCRSEGTTCRDTTKQNDHSHCDLGTGACVTDTACPQHLTAPDGTENKCTDNTGVDPTTGLCLYETRQCPTPGCFIYECVPDTGACEADPNNPRNVQCGQDDICNSSQCSSSACTYFTCAPVGPQNNCLIANNRDCIRTNPSTCQVVGCENGIEGCLNGCKTNVGCVYAVRTDCAPPTDPCMELVMDGTADGCCTYRAKDCAGTFGNDAAFTYGCDAGVCTATPQ